MTVKWSMKQAFVCWIGSLCFTLTLSLWGYFHWKEEKTKRLVDEKHHLLSIVQTGPEKEALKTEILAEFLDLSMDQPISLYALDLKKAREKLLVSPLIAKAELKRLPPGALYIDYEVRHPIAWLADYQNIAIDREGYFFPVAPFFSPKQLPEIYLGLPPFEERGEWRISLEDRHLHLAFEILQFLEGAVWREGLSIKRIDVSNAFAPTLGQREVVVFTEEEISFSQGGKEIFCTFPKILRLMPKDYTQQLNHFFALRRTMVEDYKKQIASVPGSGRFAPRIVDLRIPQLAFVQNH